MLSEYGITPARRPVDVNRALRRAGLLRTSTPRPGWSTSTRGPRAPSPSPTTRSPTSTSATRRTSRAREVLGELPAASPSCSRATAKEAAGLGHPRAGELVAIAEPDAWFTYYYWLDDERAPDFARTVEIHRKPGYDPAELFLDPDDRWVKARAGAALARKKTGFRYVMNVVPLDPRHVRGTHGRLPDDARDAPVLLCSEPSVARDRIAATEVRDLLLELSGVRASEPAAQR